MSHWAFISQLNFFLILSVFLLNNRFFPVYFIFHNIYQNYYFSGKINQKTFSELIQFLHFICFATFQNHVTVTIAPACRFDKSLLSVKCRHASRV